MCQDLKHFHDCRAALRSPGSMLWDTALLLTQEHQNLPTLEMNCSLNVKFDPKTTKLIWDYKKNATYGEYVLIHKKKGQIKKKLKVKEYQCTFPDCSLHRWVTLPVEVNINQRQLSEMLVYTNAVGETQLPKTSPVLSTMRISWYAPGSKARQPLMMSNISCIQATQRKKKLKENVLITWKTWGPTWDVTSETSQD